MEHLSVFLRDEHDPEWIITISGQPLAPPTMPKNCALYKHHDRKLTVMVAVEDNGLLHVSVSRHDGQPATNEEVQWLANDILEGDLHFQEHVPPQIKEIRKAVRKKLDEMYGPTMQVPDHPIVRHFYHPIKEA